MAKRKNQPIRQALKNAGMKLKGKEIDHIVPLADGGTNAVSNLQVIGKGAHNAKTKVENAARKGRRGLAR